MEYFAKTTDLGRLDSQCQVVFAQGTTLLPSAQTLDHTQRGLLQHCLKQGDLKPEAGHCLHLTLPAQSDSGRHQHALLVQLGADQNPRLALPAWRKACQALATALRETSAKNAAVFCDNLADGSAEFQQNLAQTLAQCIETTGYRYSATLSKPQPPAKLKKLTVACPSAALSRAATTGLRRGAAIGGGINLTRQLGNLPANICTPAYLSGQARDLAQHTSALTVKILGEKQMEKLGMGSLLSVARGSELDAQLIVMNYDNRASKKAGDKPFVLVGKGITFDTGGISLKPGAAMDEMKFDMCGAASVFGTLRALIDMNAPVHVVGIVAAAENMPSGRATKPGDVVTSMSGQTIEVLNTDAEGRLVLCDALTYAERFKPKAVVDIATLTGACVVALGRKASGLYSNDEHLAQALLDAGEHSGDRAWRMPLWDEYQEQLKSNFADMANIGGPEAGSVTAACFLSRFAKSYPWAHLDIAGTAWHSGAKKGASGRPVALLVNYLLGQK